MRASLVMVGSDGRSSSVKAAASMSRSRWRCQGERSPWHRQRLRDIDAAAFTEDDLPSLPTMTKDDLMDNFEAVVTDPRLTPDVVGAYVEDLPENLYLFDRYLVVASGGSSGRRGVF